MVKLARVCVALALVGQPRLQAQAPGDPEVVKGIKQVEDGDLDLAIFTLDAAARRLSANPAHARDTGQAYLYLGIAYLGRGQELLAKAKFREAVQQARELSLSPDQYPPKVIELFEAAKREALTSAPSPVASPAPPKKGGSKTPLIIAGVVLAGGGGIALARGGGGGSSSATTTATPSYRLDASDVQSFPTHGGGNGSTSLACPAGQLMVGITGLFDTNVVLGLAAICALLLPDGSLTGEFVTATAGSTVFGNVTPINDRCPSGQAIVRVSGAEGEAPIRVQAIQSIAITCADVRGWVASGALGQVFPPNGTNRSGLPSAPFTDSCPMGYVVTSFSSGTGSAPPPNQGTRIVERLQTTCTRIRP